MQGRFDARFSDPEATATPWEDAERALADAGLYWLTTVRRDGRPHATPLVGVRFGGTMHFVTGLDEQKARNLEANPEVVLVTGTNTWDAGLDAIVEGTAVRVTDQEKLTAVADAFVAKYGEVWRFGVGHGVLTHGGGGAAEAGLFRIDERKVLAFAKDPHAQTAFDLV